MPDIKEDIGRIDEFRTEVQLLPLFIDNIVEPQYNPAMILEPFAAIVDT